ncbi:hypothetical protein OEZ85_008346 [Tetradesmus obliquus]|uniref:SOUL heme-binding protein n=1 Tax=Tetradesmus obliquus TaxID=3088 RepID=A0ABY8TJ36_TETOB|nr:hypothetical protein OEZ85_008346 [Tetradesmus obliquus]
MKLSHALSCLGATQQWHLRGSAPHPTRHCRSARTLAAPPAAGGEGGLFGGLKQAFSNPGKQQQQQQQQQAPQQQPTPQQQQPPPRAAGTVAAPEFPPYQVFKKGAVYDLRFHSPYPVVEMDYERREMAYLALGEYQSGSNASSTKFGFTQPVVMQYHPDGRKVMQMMVGSRRDQQQQQQQQGTSADITSLPAPSDAAVRLSVAGGELVAVLPFEGYITPEAAAAARQRLLRALEADGLKLAMAEAGGMFRVAQYGAVHTLEARVNEMMLAVAV